MTSLRRDSRSDFPPPFLVEGDGINKMNRNESTAAKRNASLRKEDASTLYPSDYQEKPQAATRPKT